MTRNHDGLGGQARRGSRVAASIRVSAVIGRGDELISPEIQEQAIRSLCERVPANEIDGIAVHNIDCWGRRGGLALGNEPAVPIPVGALCQRTVAVMTLSSSR